MAEPQDRGMYAIIPKRLFRVVEAARKADDSQYAINNVMLRRVKGRLEMVATDGHCMVLVDTPADKTLFEAGQVVILPRELVQAITKSKGKAEDPIEIVDQEGEGHVLASFANGTTITTNAAQDGKYPSIDKVIRKGDPDVTLTLNMTTLTTAIRAIQKSCPDVSAIAFRLWKGQGTLEIDASDGESRVLAVLASAETTVADIPIPKDKETSKEAALATA